VAVAVAAVAAVAVAGAGAADVGGPTPARHGPEPGITETTLPSGVRVVTERMPEATSVTVGVWVGVGSRDEPDEQAGVSHFLEHLLFKGTPERSARSIAVAVDAVGGEMNAFTTREHTAYYTRLPAGQLAFGLDLLTDVVASPAFRAADIEAEREVILEEILLNEDMPDDLVMNVLYESVFPQHPLGRETLGTEASIEAMSREEIAAFHAEHYRPANLVVAAAGALDHDEVVDGVASFLDGVDPGVRPVRSTPSSAIEPLAVVRRPTEQAHVALGWRGLHYDEPDRNALYVANHVLGGGMSSRLFQEIREERGLAYTVFSSPSLYTDCGSLVVYAGTGPARVAELLDVIDDVVHGLLERGITAEEHDVALGYLDGSLLLGLEDSGSRMARIGGSELQRGEVIPIEEHRRRIRAVTADDVQRVVQRVFAGSRSLAVVGPFDDDDPRLGGRPHLEG